MGDRFITDRKNLDIEISRWKLLSDVGQQDTVYTSALYKTFGFADQRGVLSHREPNQNMVCIPPLRPLRNLATEAKRTLDLPGLVDDYYLNTLDWGALGLAAIALGSKVYIFNPSTKEIETEEIIDTGHDDRHFTALSFMQTAPILAVADSGNRLTITDNTKHTMLHTLKLDSPSYALAWNSYLLSTGHKNGTIQHRDIRDKTRITDPYRYPVGHSAAGNVCGLKWSLDFKYLASGGNDDKLIVWDHRLTRCPLYNFNNHHKAAVKAIAWSPHESRILASGGGTADHTVRIWDISNGTCKSITDANSQVAAMQWNRHRHELVTAHGFPRHGITVWRYPSMKIEETLTGHTARILHMVQSPDGRRIMSAASDETLRIWKIEKKKKMPQKKQKVVNSILDGHIIR
jgi:WD40 repeat protein